LEKDFVVKPHELVGEKPLNKPLWCFGNLWVFTSKVSELYLEELKDVPINEKWKYHFLKSYRNRLAYLIKRMQVQEETFINGLSLAYVNLTNIDLCKAYLITAKLRGTNLSKAFLCGINLGFVDLRNANLKGVFLSDAYLRGADLSDANLSKANLTNADLTDAILEDANLEGADLRGAIFDPEEIKKAKNWDKAIYDDEVKKKLGLE